MRVVSSTPSNLIIRYYTDDVISSELTVPPSNWWVSSKSAVDPTIMMVHIDGIDDDYPIDMDELWCDEPTIRIFLN
jgi:hypothetical protein